MRNLILDLRHTLRQWKASPTFAAVSIFSLALGTGATTTVFSVVHAVLIDPYPYRGADRMVRLRIREASGARNFLLLSADQFSALGRIDALDGAIAMDRWDMASTGDDLPEAVHAAHLSDGAFAYFGVPPSLGRYFSGSAADELVLAYAFWQRRYAGRKDALGRTLELDHRNYTIIGVAPPRFRWGDADVYTPLRTTEDPDRVYIVDARLKRGVSRQQAAAQLQPLTQEFAARAPARFPPQFRVEVTPLAIGEGNTRTTLLTLLASVAVLLAVGCANVSILLLARGAARTREFAVRAAMGAGRWRLWRQLLTESVALAIAGGAAGIGLAVAGTRAIGAWLPHGVFPPETDIHVSLPVLAFTTAISVVTGILFGVSPAARFSTTDLHGAMRPADRSATAGAGNRRAHGLLIGLQIALTLLLLTGAAAALRAFEELYRASPGFDPRHVLTASISLPDGSYTSHATRIAFYERIRQAAADLPGVRSAAISLFAIPPGGPVTRSLEIRGRTLEKDQPILVEEITPEYFAALDIPLLSGRSWSPAETARGAHVAVINQAMARRFFPGVNPIGRQLRLPNFTAFTAWTIAARDSNGWLEITGICGDTPLDGLRNPAPPAVYVPFTLVVGDSMNLVVRTAGAPLNMVHAIRERVRAIDPGQPVTEIRTAEDLLREQGWEREQFVASVFGGFAALAIALAATGLYSVMSFATAVRSREFAIRLAVGAQKGQLVSLVLRSAGVQVAAGLAAGAALSVASNRLLGRWIAWRGADPLWLCAMVGLLLAASMAACLIPTLRAVNRDPLDALREG